MLDSISGNKKLWETITRVIFDVGNSDLLNLLLNFIIITMPIVTAVPH